MDGLGWEGTEDPHNQLSSWDHITPPKRLMLDDPWHSLVTTGWDSKPTDPLLSVIISPRKVPEAMTRG